MVKQFIAFLKEYGVVGLAIAVIIGNRSYQKLAPSDQVRPTRTPITSAQ